MVHSRTLEQNSTGLHSYAAVFRVSSARWLLAGWLLASVACTPTEEGALPPNAPDPKTVVRTANGAMALYAEAFLQFATTFERVTMISGLITDELAALSTQPGENWLHTDLDSRQANLRFGPNRLHQTRAQAREAREFLRAYAPDSSPSYRARIYALEGYAEIFLADLFCSGIPLSTVDFDGNYTLAAGSTTEEVYEHALALLDTAGILASQSPPPPSLIGMNLVDLAKVGRGRALLALGRYSEAAVAVSGVPDVSQHPITVAWDNIGAFGATELFPPDSLALIWYWTRAITSANNNRRIGAPSVGDMEGGNGLNYRTSGDPRTVVIVRGTSPLGQSLFQPSRFGALNTGASGTRSFVLASGIEARLIEAEAALAAGDVTTWLVKLNQPRQNACSTIVPATMCPLANLEDPGMALSDPAAANAARVNLLFRERAFWLFLTGHRQGDLRRLVRQYSRDPNTVYPVGSYPGGSGTYGNQIVVPMPDVERQLNPKYAGCIHQNA